MSTSQFSIECQRLAQPAAADPVEAVTWSSLRIYANKKCVTRFLDRGTGEPRDWIDVPAFQLAYWVAKNWWVLLHEPAPTETIPPSSAITDPRLGAWMRRHGLRSADSGVALPRCFIHGTGRGVAVRWLQDKPDAHLSWPGYFQYGSSAHIERSVAEGALADFVSTVVHWAGRIDDSRVRSLIDQWSAISNAGADEVQFCQIAGQMGLDPYSIDSWPEGIADFLEQALDDGTSPPILEDVVSATGPHSAAEGLSWARKTITQFALKPGRLELATEWLGQHDLPHEQGYHAARLVRERLGLREPDRLPDVGDVASALEMAPLGHQEWNHIPTSDISGAVGWRSGREPVIAAPRCDRVEKLRFLSARALYMAALGCGYGPRLLTTAKTWDQQASRSFAAELLAPRAQVAALIHEDKPEDDRSGRIAELAKHFQASEWVIQHQLENAHRSPY